MPTTSIKKIYSKLLSPDLLIFFIWLLLLFLLTVIIKLQYFSILFPVIFANLGLVIFLIFRNMDKDVPEYEFDYSEQDKTNSFQIYRTIPLVSICFFLLFYSISLFSLLQESYTKNILFYLSIAICAAILVFEIFSVRSEVFQYVILFQTFFLSINIVFANHLIFTQGISLPDFGLHFNSYVMPILETGHISSAHALGIVYTIFTFHHIFASEIAIITGYNPIAIYLLFGSFIIAIGVLFVFIIGKRFVNFQFGLLTAVLFTCLDYFLMYGEHPEHVAYAFGFALICFTILLFTYRSQKPAFYIIFTISVIGVVLTHHLTAALVFVTACSLLVFDVIQWMQKKERSFPSKFIFVISVIILFFAFLLMAQILGRNPAQLANYYVSPYLKSIYSLIGNFYSSFAPVSNIPVTPVPVSTLTVTPVPVNIILVTPSPASTQSYVTPTGYDKLSFITLFENTLGSSLLVLAAVLGFCSYLKKRSWFGDITILNGIILSILLGTGILFSFVLLLPDRIYPLLQIFCLGFLGAAGILWLYHSATSKKRSIIIGCICILVALMSFFSLGSIINGFETSPFVGDNVAYVKVYTTSQDVSFTDWGTSFIQNENRKILPVPLTGSGIIDLNMVPDNSYMFFDRTRLKTGFTHWGLKFGQHSFVNIDEELFQRLDTYPSYYDNGQIILMSKPNTR